MTCWLVKSISVWIPSDPTMRVMGCLNGHGCSFLPALLVAGRQLAPRLPPLGLLVELRLDVALAEELQDRAVGELRGVRRRLTPRVGLHEGHVLVGEARHRARHADPADVGAASDAVDPAADGHIAAHHRSLAAELDQAARVVAVLGGELALLGVAGAVAALAHGA